MGGRGGGVLAAPLPERFSSPAAGAQTADGGQLGVRLADGIELLGPYQGSGCTEPQYLLRRGDGRVLVVSELLYAVVAACQTDERAGAIAAQVGSWLARPVSAGNVEYLVEHKLRPLAVVGDGEDRRRGDAAPLLGLGVRSAVVPGRLVEVAASWLRPLFLPAVVVTILCGFAAMDAWLVLAHPITMRVSDAVRDPRVVLLVTAVTLVSAGFHEIGHATGGLYGGAVPGPIGVGICLMWPAFFSNLTDSYRLARGARLRADLGGVYFNVVFMLVLFELYWTTGAQPLLVAVVLQHLLVVQQFMPFLRLDGYYIVTDVLGVPDLFSYVRPVLARLVPGRRVHPRLAVLKPRTLVLVSVWVFVTLDLMSASLVLFVTRMPRLAEGAGQLAVAGLAACVASLREGRLLGAAVACLSLLPLAIALAGLAATLARLAGRALRSWKGRSGSRPDSVAVPVGAAARA